MRKLRLDVDALTVESFDAGAEGDGRGTVRAYLTWTDPTACDHTADWHCTAGDCTRYPKACPLDESHNPTLCEA